MSSEMHNTQADMNPHDPHARMSSKIDKLMEALAKAQGTMKPAKEEAFNPFHKSHYADLNSIWDACRKPLADNGLAVSQVAEVIEGKQCLVTVLGHASGQWMRSVLELSIPNNPSAQVIGSAITYARRYALSSIVGVSTGDDDGEAAEQVVRKPPTKTAPAVNTTINEAQAKELRELIGDNVELGKGIIHREGVKKIEELGLDKFNHYKKLIMESASGSRA